MTTKPKPCRRCGGPKDRGIRGAQYCTGCHEEMQPIWRQREIDRARERGRKERRAAGTSSRVKKIAPDGRVWCGRCVDYLPANRFRLNRGRPAAYCRMCASAYAHEQRLKKVFGITVEDYDKLLEVQEGRCAICRDRPRKNRLSVDHNHITGKIRGLLCKRCNHELLGVARDSVEILERAICYLESPPADTGLPIVIHEDFERRAGLFVRCGDLYGVVMELDDFADLWHRAMAGREQRLIREAEAEARASA